MPPFQCNRTPLGAAGLGIEINRPISQKIYFGAEVDMGWVDPWVGLGWVEFSTTCVGWVVFNFQKCKSMVTNIISASLPGVFENR